MVLEMAGEAENVDCRADIVDCYNSLCLSVADARLDEEGDCLEETSCLGFYERVESFLDLW